MKLLFSSVMVNLSGQMCGHSSDTHPLLSACFVTPVTWPAGCHSGVMSCQTVYGFISVYWGSDTCVNCNVNRWYYIYDIVTEKSLCFPSQKCPLCLTNLFYAHTHSKQQVHARCRKLEWWKRLKSFLWIIHTGQFSVMSGVSALNKTIP